MNWLPNGEHSLTDLLSLVFVLLGGAFALWQYYRTNREARARAAADEIEHFNTDDAVKTALRVIDWHSGSIAYVDEIGVKQKVPFGGLDFHLALRPHVRRRSEVRDYVASEDRFAIARASANQPFEDFFSPVEQYVRDVFDSFLGRLERVEMLIECGVIGEKNFGDFFSYWLDIIGDEKPRSDPFAHFSNGKRAALIEYITYYKFNGVVRLFSRYGKQLSAGS